MNNVPFASPTLWGQSATVNVPASMTLMENDPEVSAPGPAGYTGPFAGASLLGQPFAVWLGMILVLVLLKVLSESPKTAINPAKVEIGGYNFISIGVSAAVFVMLLKILFNRFPVPGLTQFANAL